MAEHKKQKAGKPRKQKGFEFHDLVSKELQTEARTGQSMTGTIQAAVFWYCYRLDPAERDLARKECAIWLATGKIPPSTLATQIQELLGRVREQVAELQDTPKANRQ
jgi:hypothetical protein